MDNNIQEQAQLNSDDKLLAMLSHFSVFFGGILLPIILYFIQKDKSKFVAFHALQSIFFHLVYLVVIVLLVLVLIIVAILGGLLSGAHHNSSPIGFIMGMGIFYVGLFISIFGAIGYGIYMGIKAYNGENKKYFLVGDWAYRKVYGK